jgi:hypothetical protein
MGIKALNNKARKRRKLFAVPFGLTLMAISLACGFSAAAPISIRTPAATFLALALAGTPPVPHPTFEALPLVVTAVPGVPKLSLPEYRRLTLEFPPQMRVGDSEVVRLTLEADTLGHITPTAVLEGNKITGGVVQVPNLYDTHNVVAEARLDLAGADIRPADVIDEPLLPGQSVTFFWSVHPMSMGTFSGTAWLFLIFVDKASAAESRMPLSAQPIEIQATNFLGLNGGVARSLGGIGTILGAVLGFPFATDILKWLFGHFRGKAI